VDFSVGITGSSFFRSIFAQVEQSKSQSTKLSDLSLTSVVIGEEMLEVLYLTGFNKVRRENAYVIV
jgi:hypothetical protein